MQYILDEKEYKEFCSIKKEKEKWESLFNVQTNRLKEFRKGLSMEKGLLYNFIKNRIEKICIKENNCEYCKVLRKLDENSNMFIFLQNDMDELCCKVKEEENE